MLKALVVAVAVIGLTACFPERVRAAMAFQETGGQVVMEAENADANISRGDKAWELATSLAGESGAGYLTALPNSGTAYASAGTAMTMSPELQFQVQFTTPGTYYIWVRGHATSTLNDAVHCGINGDSPSTADKIRLTATNAWNWTNKDTTATATYITVPSAGMHTIHLWMNEDGFSFDKIVLTTSSTYTPTGTGPAESPRISVGGDTTAPTLNLTAPVSGATVSGTVTVSANASDNIGVAGVQFKLDGANLGAEDTASPYSVSWNTTGAVNGSHQLTAVARDAPGNSTTSAAVTVTVNNTAQDTIPPTGSISINGGAAATKLTSVTLALSAWDTGGVTQMQFSNTGSSYSAAEAYAASKSWTLAGGDGTKTVYVKYKDAAGNWSAAFTDTITLDTVAPGITITSPSDGAMVTP